MEKVRISKELAEAITYVKGRGAIDEILCAHAEAVQLHALGKEGWKAPVNILNTVSYTTMYRILQNDYEVYDRPTPLTPKLIVMPTVKVKQSLKELEVELDYELASLHHAINEGDEAEVERSKQRLSEIHREMEGA